MSAGAQVDATTLAEARQGRYWLDRESVLGPVLLLPAVIYIIALVGIPLVLAVLYSLSDVTIGDQSIDFVGLKNFRDVLNNSTFRTALQNTFVFTIVSQAVVLVGLLGVGSPLGPDWFGTNSLWLAYPDRARLSVLIVHVWRTLPLATVILLAGLTAIPQDVKDAANVDGAGFFRQLFAIRIPLLVPIMMVAVLYGIVFTFTDLIVVFILTRGGPFDSTQVLATWAYFKGIEGGSLGQGAAIALFLFPVLVGVAALMLRIAKRAETV
jgi:multiple sugar transport system permease protein